MREHVAYNINRNINLSRTGVRQYQVKGVDSKEARKSHNDWEDFEMDSEPKSVELYLIIEDFHKHRRN